MERRRFAMWPYWLVLVLLFALAMAPIVVMLNASQTAERLGCAIAGGVVATCVVDGIDRTVELQTGLGTVWYVLVTWPAAIVGTVGWLGVLMLHRGRWKARMIDHG